MENENIQSKNNFSFLEDTDVKKYFADINIRLLRGVHIQSEDYDLFSLLKEDNYFYEFRFFYKELYGLLLKRGQRGLEIYYYLDVNEDNKGKIYQSDRRKVLNDRETVIGIMLLNMYYEKYFENPKKITWEEIKETIKQSEYKNQYQKVFFKDLQSSYKDSQWEEVKKKFVRTLNSFEKLGWIKKVSNSTSDIHFELRDSIHRLASLYKNELEDIDAFVDKLDKNFQL